MFEWRRTAPCADVVTGWRDERRDWRDERGDCLNPVVTLTIISQIGAFVIAGCPIGHLSFTPEPLGIEM